MDDKSQGNALLLARIDERTKNMERQINVLEDDVKELKSKINKDMFDFKKELRETYITIHQFTPVQRAVFTAISVIVLGVGAALLNLVIPK